MEDEVSGADVVHGKIRNPYKILAGRP